MLYIRRQLEKSWGELNGRVPGNQQNHGMSKNGNEHETDEVRCARQSREQRRKRDREEERHSEKEHRSEETKRQRKGKKKEESARTDEKGNELEDAPLNETMDKLNTRPEQGLSREEAAKRLDQYGKNTLEEEKEPGWKRVPCSIRRDRGLTRSSGEAHGQVGRFIYAKQL